MPLSNYSQTKRLWHCGRLLIDGHMRELAEGRLRLGVGGNNLSTPAGGSESNERMDVR